MRVIADLSSFKILQVEKTPPEGEANPFNGRFAIPVPDGASVDVDSATYITPQDAGSLPAQMAAALLARYPMYSNIAYNFLLEDSDILDLDLTATGPTGFITRVATGRGVGPGPLGQAPNTTAILPRNNTTAPARPGCLVTDTIDITIPTGGAGADEFLIWWYLWDLTTSEDVASDFGIFAGTNNPATKSITEVDQEPASFEVWISHDDGVTWTQTSRLEPTDLITFNTLVRLAFINKNNTTPRYLAAYAVMF